jgi:photosystem II stability/assembly factor-like uncharacterized protein
MSHRPGTAALVATAALLAGTAAFSGCRTATDQNTSDPETSPSPSVMSTSVMSTSVMTVPIKIDRAWPRTHHALVYHPTDPTNMWFTYGNVLLHNTESGRGAWTESEPEAAGGNHLYALAFPAPDLFLAGSRGGLVRSLDQGTTWEGSSDSQGMGFKGLVALPESPRSLIALVADRGVLTSDDGGVTWSDVTEDVDETSFGLWLARGDPLRLVSVRRSDMQPLASDDGGATWEPLAARGLGAELTGMALTAGGTAYASTSEGLFVSADAGETWTERGELPALAAVAVSPTDQSQITVIDSRGSVYQSADGGVTW